jgi:hypothetical protein
MSGTEEFKLLINKVILRDKQWDNTGTGGGTTVGHPLGQAETVSDMGGTGDAGIPAHLLTSESEAVQWLRAYLTQPRRIGEVFAHWLGGEQRLQPNGALRWEGGREGTGGHWGADLCAARWELGVCAFIGDDGLWWWRLPQETSHESTRHSHQTYARRRGGGQEDSAVRRRNENDHRKAGNHPARPCKLTA